MCVIISSTVLDTEPKRERDTSGPRAIRMRMKEVYLCVCVFVYVRLCSNILV